MRERPWFFYGQAASWPHNARKLTPTTRYGRTWWYWRPQFNVWNGYGTGVSLSWLCYYVGLELYF